MALTQPQVDIQTLAAIYQSMYRIRRVEEEVARIYPSDKIKSPVHLAIGQEAVAAGVCQALESEDVVYGTYRSHGVYLAKGGDLKALMAELYGKATGCAKGKGGSMHIIDVAHGVMGTSAVVASTIPHAVGHAYAMKLQGKPSIVVSFFGDGAVEEGVFHEALNFAQLKKLPLLLVCENNRYAVHSHQFARQARDNIWERVASYGIPSTRFEWNDALGIYEAAQQYVIELREKGDGPRFLECLTYRWKEHVGPNEDWTLGYRSKNEALPWIERDELVRVGGMLETAIRSCIEQEVEQEVAEAIAFAEVSPFPDAAELYTDIFKN